MWGKLRNHRWFSEYSSYEHGYFIIYDAEHGAHSEFANVMKNVKMC